MNQNEQNFTELQRLLKLKRHEVPPPGYFANFSDRVTSRIRRGEAGGARTLMERLEVEATWLMSFLRIFETRPGIIGAFSVCICLMMVSIVVSSHRAEKAARLQLNLNTTASVAGNPMASMVSPTVVASADSGGIVASTNPVTTLQPTATLFGQPGDLSGQLFQPAGFAPQH
jgi:hypothetical protein